MENEIWKDVIGYESLYQVSNLGRVKSMRYGRELFLSLCINKKGYLTFNLYKDGKAILVRVHRVVAENFIPNPENKLQINHIDCNKKNNRVDNLEWNTQSENQIHAFKNKLIDRRGASNSQVKLTDIQVKEIKDNGFCDSYINIGKKYNVSSACIWLILNNVSWKHI